MSTLAIHSEWWYTDSGDLLSATDGGDYNHEGHVMEAIIGEFCEVMGIDNQYATDATWFRTDVGDQVDWDAVPEGYDPIDEAGKLMDHPPEMVREMRAFLGGSQKDARAFAIKWWGWIRLAGPNAEAPNLAPAMLKRVYEAFATVYFEEESEEAPEDAEVTVSLLNGTRHYVTLGALSMGTLEGAEDADLAHLSRVSTEQVKQMDRDAQPAFYRGKLGDSVIRTIRRLLVESSEFDEWVGVDLDGTLAHYEEFEGPTIIGKPIPKMIECVQGWLRDGYGPDKIKLIKVFTARVHGDDAEEVSAAIHQWCKRHIGQELPVTNEKNPGMIALIDDKVELLQVKSNTGELVEQLLSESRELTGKVDHLGSNRGYAISLDGSLYQTGNHEAWVAANGLHTVQEFQDGLFGVRREIMRRHGLARVAVNGDVYIDPPFQPKHLSHLIDYVIERGKGICIREGEKGQVIWAPDGDTGDVIWQA